MLRCCQRIGKLLRPALFVSIMLAISYVGGHTQNPFDIQSRKLLDSTASIAKTDMDSKTDTVKVSNVDSHSDSISIIPVEPIPADTHKLQLPPTQTPTVENTDNSQPDLIPPFSRNNGLLGEVELPTGSATSASWWFYVYDLILLLLLLGAFLYDKKIFPPLKKAFLHENFLRFLYRDTFLRKPGIFLYLNFIFLVCLGFILFRVAQHFSMASGVQDYLLIQGVVLLLFLLKHISLQLLTRLVDKPFEVRFYRYWMISSAGLIGLWLIPVTLMISVLPSDYLWIALVISCFLLILLLIYRQIKAMVQAKFFLSKHFFHFFLYFCAVEVVPVLLLADILVNY